MTLARLPHRNDPAHSRHRRASIRRRHPAHTPSLRPTHSLSRHPNHPLRSITP